MKKIIAMLLTGVIALSFCACSFFKKEEPTTQTTAAATTTEPTAKKELNLAAPKPESYRLYIDDEKQKAWTLVKWNAQEDVTGYQVQFGTQADPDRQVQEEWVEDLCDAEGADNTEWKTEMPYGTGFDIDMARVRNYTIEESGKITYGEWSEAIYLDVANKIMV